MKKAIIVLANGFEDVEAITPIDYLRRADVDLKIAGLDSLTVTTSHGVTINCEMLFKDVEKENLPDLIVLPGGLKGSQNLAAAEELKTFVKKMFEQNRYIAAICAAPALVLGSWGLLETKQWTGYPGFGENFPIKPSKQRVVCDGTIITAQGPGCAEEFSLELVEILCGENVRNTIAKEILAR